MNRSASFRRHQLKKAEDRTRRHFPWMSDHNVKRHRHARALCSCEMCGNPRRHFGKLTISEMKAQEAASEQLKRYK